MQYEYKAIATHYGSVEEVLNNYAQQGWEYVNIIPYFYPTSRMNCDFKVVFKRQKR
jgi:hypothetical protein